MKIFIAVLCVVVSVISAARLKRQTNCVDPFANVANPCKKGASMVFFPHPTIASMFLECDIYGRMFIAQCPAGEQYFQSTTSCHMPEVTTVAPVAVTTVAPGVMTNNPCTPENLGNGKNYFSIAGDNKNFIECDLNGDAHVLPCPPELVWDETRLSCVYVFVATNPLPTSTAGVLPGTGGAGSIKNPCLEQTVTTAAGLFFPHPDPHKFIQCDIATDAFVLTCPSGLVWNQYSLTCVSAFVQAATVVG